MTPAELQSRAAKVIKARADETALVNGRNHTRSLDEHRYYAGVCDGMLAAIEIMNETMKHADDEDE